MLDCLERLRRAVALVRVVTSLGIDIPLVGPSGVEVYCRVRLGGEVQHRLLVRVGDSRPVRGRHPSDEGVSRARERIPRERRVLSVGAPKRGHRAAAAVRVELHGVGVHLPHGVEVDRAVGGGREVVDGLLVRIRRGRRAAGGRPALERVARAREGVRRQRLRRTVGHREVRHRPGTAVRIELDGVRDRRPLGRHRLRAEPARGDLRRIPSVEHIARHVRQCGERDAAVIVVLRRVRVRRALRVRVGDGVVREVLECGRVVGRAGLVREFPIVGLRRIWRPGIRARLRQPRHRRTIHGQRTRCRLAPRGIIGNRLLRCHRPRSRSRIQRRRRALLAGNQRLYGADGITPTHVKFIDAISSQVEI